MTRSLGRAARAAAIVAALGTSFAVGAAFDPPAQARLIKEMQAVRSGKVIVADEGQLKVYKLVLQGNKLIVLGDREFFPPATRAALDQAVEKKLSVEAAGHLLIFNDQPPVFTLPLGGLTIKGLDMGPAAGEDKPAQAASGQTAQTAEGLEAIKDGQLRFNTSTSVGKALENYAFFTSRDWKMLEPGKAEFRGAIDLSSITEQDSRYVSRLRSRNLADTFKSTEFVAVLTQKPGGPVESLEPAVEAVFADGTRDRMTWKDPPNYYWDRIYRNRKIKLDYFLSKAALNPKYGKGMETPAAE